MWCYVINKSQATLCNKQAVDSPAQLHFLPRVIVSVSPHKLSSALSPPFHWSYRHGHRRGQGQTAEQSESDTWGQVWCRAVTRWELGQRNVELDGGRWLQTWRWRSTGLTQHGRQNWMVFSATEEDTERDKCPVSDIQDVHISSRFEVGLITLLMYMYVWDSRSSSELSNLSQNTQYSAEAHMKLQHFLWHELSKDHACVTYHSHLVFHWVYSANKTYTSMYLCTCYFERSKPPQISNKRYWKDQNVANSNENGHKCSFC